MLETIWLVGEGRWGSKIRSTLADMGISVSSIDMRQGTSIWDVNDSSPIIIATPTQLHHDHARHFISRGYDIFIEKPACERPEQIRDLLSLIKDDQIVMPGHLYMFHPFLSEVKSIIDDGVIGDIRHIHCERTNLGTYQTKDVLINNIALHDLTIIEELFGITQIKHAAFTDISGNGLPDRAIILGKANSIDWQIDASWLSASRRRMLSITGSSGQIVWDDDKNTLQVTTTDISGDTLVCEKLAPLSRQGPPPLWLELEHFLGCVITRSRPKVDLSHALRISELIAEIGSLRMSS